MADLRAYVEEGKELPDRPVVITFDDGYTSNLEIGLPVLEVPLEKGHVILFGLVLPLENPVADGVRVPALHAGDEAEQRGHEAGAHVGAGHLNADDGLGFVRPEVVWGGVDDAAILWASSYLHVYKGIPAETAAGYAGLFFLGITAGRALSGFLTMKLSDPQFSPPAAPVRWSRHRGRLITRTAVSAIWSRAIYR